MGDGFFVSLDSHLDGIASALGSNELLPNIGGTTWSRGRRM